MVVATLDHPAKTLDGFFQHGAFLRLREVSLRYALSPQLASTLRARSADIAGHGGANLATLDQLPRASTRRTTIGHEHDDARRPVGFPDGRPRELLHPPPVNLGF